MTRHYISEEHCAMTKGTSAGLQMPVSQSEIFSCRGTNTDIFIVLCVNFYSVFKFLFSFPERA